MCCNVVLESVHDIDFMSVLKNIKKFTSSDISETVLEAYLLNGGRATLATLVTGGGGLFHVLSLRTGSKLGLV